MNLGYIKLYRKVTSSFVWTNADMLKLWILCLTKASHETHKFLFNGQEVYVTKGQFVTGAHAIAKEYNDGVPRDKAITWRTLWRWLKKFESEKMLTIQSNARYSVISIKNWSDYQVNDKPLTTQGQSDDKPVTTYKNDKNYKNEKNDVVVDKEPVDLSDVLNHYQSVFGMANPIMVENLQYWCQDLSSELVIEALKVSAVNNATSFKYTEGIMRNWEKRNVQTLNDVKALNVEFQNKNNRQESKPKAKQRNYDAEELPDRFKEVDWG